MSERATAAGSLGLGEIRHIGRVVSKIESAVQRVSYPGAPTEWVGWVYGPDYLRWHQVDGADADFAARIAVSGGPTPGLELIEPLSPGSSWAEVLRHGEGAVHHVGFIVEDFWSEIERLRSWGFKVAEMAGGHGLDGDGALAYVDTREVLGMYAEVIQPPARRAAPHFSVMAATSVGSDAAAGSHHETAASLRPKEWKEVHSN